MINEAEKKSNELMGTHKFLAEELFVPNLNKTDANRINMFNNHVVQMLVMDKMEYPRIFTNFENQIGKYSSSYKVADRKWKILKRFDKNKMNYTLLLIDEDNNIEIQHITPAKRVTQRYGYLYQSDKLDAKDTGDYIEKDEILYKTSAYDDNLNFKYGTNLKTVYLSFKNLQYEDSIIISDVAAEKLANHNVDEIEITLNNNDLLVNLLGDTETYKCFPDIGEKLDGRILAARRRINYNSILHNLTTEKLNEVDFSNDTVFYVDDNTIVTDIDIYCNGDVEKLNKLAYYKQIMEYYEANNAYYEEIVDFLEYFIADPVYKCSDDVLFYYNRYKKIINPDVKWRFNKNIFDNIVIKIKTISKNPLYIGSKISGRYGKGINM